MTVIIISSVNPTSKLAGWPIRLPVRVSKTHHSGWLVIEKNRLSSSKSLAYGVKEKYSPCLISFLVFPWIDGGLFSFLDIDSWELSILIEPNFFLFDTDEKIIIENEIHLSSTGFYHFNWVVFMCVTYIWTIENITGSNGNRISCK